MATPERFMQGMGRFWGNSPRHATYYQWSTYRGRSRDKTGL